MALVVECTGSFCDLRNPAHDRPAQVEVARGDRQSKGGVQVPRRIPPSILTFIPSG
jgi:hypothetical protein